MFGIFIPRTWKFPRFVWFLMIFEIPFTVANLTLFGIASPNLYRTILWRVGGQMGFNSDPSTVLYMYANYKPVHIPAIWSSFNTEYHLVIGVLCLFFWLVKATLWVLHIFPPLLSLLLHMALLILWAYGISMQTGSDTLDPARPSRGLPWYIRKNCDIVKNDTIKGYCMQAKSAFAVSVVMLCIYAFFILISAYSLIPTPEARQAYEAKKAEKKAEKEKWANSPIENAMTPEEQWQHMWELQQLPRTPGYAPSLKGPMTPRTQTFSQLEGGYYSNMTQGQGGFYADGGGAHVQSISPVDEREEYSFAGKGKAHTDSAC